MKKNNHTRLYSGVVILTGVCVTSWLGGCFCLQPFLAELDLVIKQPFWKVKGRTDGFLTCRFVDVDPTVVAQGKEPDPFAGRAEFVHLAVCRKLEKWCKLLVHQVDVVIAQVQVLKVVFVIDLKVSDVVL